MNVCTFVGKIWRISNWGSYVNVDIYVEEHYTNSKGEKKVESVLISCRAYSTAGEYTEKNAAKGDHIALRGMLKTDRNDCTEQYIRINEFRLIKD